MMLHRTGFLPAGCAARGGGGGAGGGGGGADGGVAALAHRQVRATARLQHVDTPGL